MKILVGTCDKYKDTWEPFIHGFKKYWANCPWVLCWACNTIEPAYGTPLLSGEYNNWSRTMISALNKINDEVILLLLDDYWLTKEPDTKKIERYVDLLLGSNVEHIRLIPSEDIEGSFCDLDVNLFKNDAPYRCSTQAGLWKRQTLLDLLKDGEDIWTFENEASKRSKGKLFTCANKYLIHYVYPEDPDFDWKKQPVENGKWTKDAKRYIQKEKLGIILGKNPND